MRLAVLLDAERERLDAQYSGGSPACRRAFDHRLVRSFPDLLRAQILARQVDVFNGMLMPFPCHSLVRRQALRALGKASESSQEGGNTGRRAMQPYRPKRAGRPFSSRPGSSGERALYADFARVQPQKRLGSRYLAGVFVTFTLSRSSIARIWSARRTAIAAPSRRLCAPAGS